MAESAVPRIKVCGVTSLRDAQMVADAGADALGLIFAASVRQVVGPASGDIVRHLGERLWCVGVFRHQEDHEIVRIVERDGLRTVQLHDPASGSLLDALAAREVRVIRALRTHDTALNQCERAQIVAVIVDGAQPGSGVANDWSALAAMSFEVPLIAAGGLDPENVAHVIAEVRPWGVDVASGVEYVHGVKDPVKVANFVSRAREALTLKGAQ